MREGFLKQYKFSLRSRKNNRVSTPTNLEHHRSRLIWLSLHRDWEQTGDHDVLLPPLSTPYRMRRGMVWPPDFMSSLQQGPDRPAGPRHPNGLGDCRGT